MKKSLLLLPFALLASAATIVSIYQYFFTTPEYVQDAQERVSSYLTSSYGPVSCKSSHKDNIPWDLVCLSPKKKLKFEYTVYPARMAPYDVSHSFYIKAVTSDAILSADTNLLHYLKIDTSRTVN